MNRESSSSRMKHPSVAGGYASGGKSDSIAAPFDPASTIPAITSRRYAVANTIHKVASCLLLIVCFQTAPCAQSLSNKSIQQKDCCHYSKALSDGGKTPLTCGNVLSDDDDDSAVDSNAALVDSDISSADGNMLSSHIIDVSACRNALNGNQRARASPGSPLFR